MAAFQPSAEDLTPFPDLEADPTLSVADGEAWNQSSQRDGTQSVAASEQQNQIQAFAKLEFDDGEFYMNTYAVELGRDIRAARIAAQRELPVPRKRSASDGGSVRSSRSRKDPSRRYGVVSETGGVIGVDPLTSDQEKDSTRMKAKSPSSSSQQLSRKSSLNMPKVDYNALALESLPEGALGSMNTESGVALPSPDLTPLIPIHPPTSVDGFSTGHKSISRKHIRIAFNFESHLFEVKVLGVNGVFIDEEWYAQGEVQPLVSGSVLQIGTVGIRFVLPDVPPGETGAEMAEGSDPLSGVQVNLDMTDSYEGEDVAHVEHRNRRRKISDLPTTAKIANYTPTAAEDMPKPKRKGPGRPPKNGIISKREQALLARQAREDAKAAAEGDLRPSMARSKGKSGKAELGASNLQPNGKRKYTKRKRIGADLEQHVRESTEQTDSMAPDGGAPKPKEKSKPIKPPRSPSPVFDESKLTPEQLAKPQQSYVVLIHEALSNSKTGQMSLPQIYRAIERRYPFFKLRVQTQGWQSSVRHNLSQHAAFKKIERDGKGWMWGLVPEVSIEKEKKRRATPPPQPQQQYYQHPPPYPQQPYPFPGMAPPAGAHMPAYPYGMPRLPYPSAMHSGGFPIPLAKPQGESTYKSPYESSAPTTTAEPNQNPGSANIGNVQQYPPTMQQSLVSRTTPAGVAMGPPVQNGINVTGVTADLSNDVLTAVQKFKTALVDSMDDKGEAERLVSAAIQKTFPSSLNGSTHSSNALSNAQEKAVSAALSNALSSLHRKSSADQQHPESTLNGVQTSSSMGQQHGHLSRAGDDIAGVASNVAKTLPMAEPKSRGVAQAALNVPQAQDGALEKKQGRTQAQPAQAIEKHEKSDTREEPEQKEAAAEQEASEDSEDQEGQKDGEEENNSQDDRDNEPSEAESETASPCPSPPTSRKRATKPTTAAAAPERRPALQADSPPRGRRRKRTGSDETTATPQLGVSTRARDGMVLRDAKRVAT